jgi:hypothetical protein
VGLSGAIVGMTTFGESAPAEQLLEEYGFTVENVVAQAKAFYKRPYISAHRDKLTDTQSLNYINEGNQWTFRVYLM